MNQTRYCWVLVFVLCGFGVSLLLLYAGNQRYVTAYTMPAHIKIPQHDKSQNQVENKMAAKNYEKRKCNGTPEPHVVKSKKQSEELETAIQYGCLPTGEEEEHERRRNVDDGAWYASKGSVEIYVYSAFYDARSWTMKKTYVRLIAVTEKVVAEQNSYCVLWFPKDIKPLIVKIKPLPIGMGVGRHGKSLREYVYTCELPDKSQIPHTVSIVLKPNAKPDFFVPVEVPQEYNKPIHFGVCVSISYWKQDPYRILEWVEIQKLLGVEKILIYNNSMDDAPLKVLQHYVKQGIVEVRKSSNFVSDPGEGTFWLHMSPVINDCIYRNMYHFQKIPVIDLDEMIIPHQHLDLGSMLNAIDANQTVKHPARSYVFRNTYFFFELPPEENEPDKVATLRHRKRLPPSPGGYSVKSIMDPMLCAAMHNHYCWTNTPLYEKTEGKQVDVVPYFGMNHHYKKCHLDKWEHKKGVCHEKMQDAVQDDTMLKFKENLVRNIAAQFKQLGMEPLTPN